MSAKPHKGRKFSDIKVFRNSSIKFLRDSNLTARHVAAIPLALTFGGLFYLYARSSVHAAKQNAKLHRMADGGQISWRNENQRRHGALSRPEQQFTIKGLAGDYEGADVKMETTQPGTTPEDERLKARKTRRKPGGG